MKNLIYQYWDGKILAGVKAGSENMKKYANRIGVDYLFEDNPKFVTNLGKYSPHYGAFKPIYDETFHIYDNGDCVFWIYGSSNNSINLFKREWTYKGVRSLMKFKWQLYLHNVNLQIS